VPSSIEYANHIELLTTLKNKKVLLKSFVELVLYVFTICGILYTNDTILPITKNTFIAGDTESSNIVYIITGIYQYVLRLLNSKN